MEKQTAALMIARLRQKIKTDEIEISNSPFHEEIKYDTLIALEMGHEALLREIEAEQKTGTLQNDERR